MEKRKIEKLSVRIYYCRDEFVKDFVKIDTIKNIIREQEMKWIKIEERILNDSGLVLDK